MRDLVLLLVFSAGTLYALRRPWVGAMLWTWVSLMSPHVEFGWRMASQPVGMVIAVATLIGLFLTRERQSPMVASPMWVMLALVTWVTITLPFSFHLNSSLDLWIRSMKIFLMLFVTVALIDNRKKLEVFIWVFVLSVGFYGFKGGIFTLMTGGNFRVWGPGGFIQGNNELAVALLMTIPLVRYLQMQQAVQWKRHGMTIWMILCMVSVVGTYSRGALLGISVMSLMLWFKADRKLLWGGALVMAVLVALPLMPDHYWDRMRTIQTYDEDYSAMSRIHAWQTAFNLANDRVLLGGGFMIAMPDVFARYAPVPMTSLAAHSIYFQILGEHGWVGLFLFLGLGANTWMAARNTIRLCNGKPNLQWAADLSRMCQVSLVGYAAGGAFLSLAYFDGPYNVVAIVTLAQYLVMRQAALVETATGGGAQHGLAGRSLELAEARVR